MLRCLLLLTTFLVAPSVRAQEAPDRPKNLVVLIADGFGPATAVLGREVGGAPLALDSLLRGAVKTSSASQRITDSAAGAVAYSSGINTTNRYVGVDTLGAPVGTLLEAAEAEGMATGLVSTSYITDATPAAFYAHSQSRYASDVIASQLLERGVEVILGGGHQNFLPQGSGGIREDGRNLFAEAEALGYDIGTTPEELAALSVPALGLFAREMMAMEIDREATEPSLLAMTQRALDLLDGAAEGFVLIVETEGTDNAGHYNDPAALAREVLSYDAVVAAVLDFAHADGETLVVSLSDHETGGLTVGLEQGYHTDFPYLRRVSASTRRMARLLDEGGEVDEVMRDYAGIDSLTAEEHEALSVLDEAGRVNFRAISRVISRRARVGWTTRGHTAIDVGLYAWGPGAERFHGVMENDAVGRALADVLGLDLAAVTAKLRADDPDTAP